MGRTVHKIGGANMSQLDQVSRLVGEYLPQQESQAALVVSAFKGMTDALLAGMDMITEKGSVDPQVTKPALEQVENLLMAQVKKNPSEKLREETAAKVQTALQDLRRDLKDFGDANLRVRPETYAIRDQVIGFGEDVSAMVLAAHLKAQGVDVQLISDVEFDSEGSTLHEGIQRGLANSLSEISESVQEKVLLFGGHVGGLPRGIAIDIGRSYSDTTAVDLAVALRSVENGNGGTVFWKDVPGLMTTNPKDLKDPSKAIRMPDVSLYEALEIARAGSSLLQVQALELAERHRVALVLKNITEPTSEGTNYGVNRIDTGYPFKSIASHPHDCLELDITEVGGEAGVVEHFGRIFTEAGISVNDVSTEGNTLNFTIPLPRDESDKEALRSKIRSMQSKFSSIEINGVRREINCRWSQERLSNVALVGSEIKDQEGMLSVLGAALATQGINIFQIGHTPTQHRISFYVADRDREKAVQALHAYFIEKDRGIHEATNAGFLQIASRYAPDELK